MWCSHLSFNMPSISVCAGVENGVIRLFTTYLRSSCLPNTHWSNINGHLGNDWAIHDLILIFLAFEKLRKCSEGYHARSWKADLVLHFYQRKLISVIVAGLTRKRGKGGPPWIRSFLGDLNKKVQLKKVKIGRLRIIFTLGPVFPYLSTGRY